MFKVQLPHFVDLTVIGPVNRQIADGSVAPPVLVPALRTRAKWIFGRRRSALKAFKMQCRREFDQAVE